MEDKLIHKRTQLFIDGAPIDAKGITGNGRWVTIDAEGLPTSGCHHLQVVVPGAGTAIEVDCVVTMFDEEGEIMLQPRFFLTGDPREIPIDNLRVFV